MTSPFTRLLHLGNVVVDVVLDDPAGLGERGHVKHHVHHHIAEVQQPGEGPSHARDLVWQANHRRAGRSPGR